MSEASTPNPGDVHALGLMRLMRLITTGNSIPRTPGLDVRQQLVIHALGLEGPKPLHTIADELALSRSTMTGVADRLERAGLVERQHPKDRRVTLLELTAEGRAVFEHEVEWFSFLVTGTLDSLPDEMAIAVRAALATFAPS